MASYASTVDLRNELAELVNRVAFGKERVIVTRRGKEVAALVPLEDLRLLERLVEEVEDRIDVSEAEAALAEADTEGTVTLDQLVDELGL